MSRRDISGRSDEAMTTPGAACREIMSGEDFNGENCTFHLIFIIIYNSHATDAAVVDIYDQDEAAATAANQRWTIIAAAGSTTVFTLPEPGFLFYTNITAATTGGTIEAYEIAAGGYTVGGH